MILGFEEIPQKIYIKDKFIEKLHVDLDSNYNYIMKVYFFIKLNITFIQNILARYDFERIRICFKKYVNLYRKKCESLKKLD